MLQTLRLIIYFEFKRNDSNQSHDYVEDYFYFNVSTNRTRNGTGRIHGVYLTYPWSLSGITSAR